MSTTQPPRDLGPGSDHTARFQHVTVDEGDLAACTIFPREMDENAMATQWITASGDSFVSLRECR
ncbi:hypothetical protein ACFO5R_06295 [Halosolutus amylolyticus]|uniref:DUF7511 domain-containing protein n=1 Tax=Halosolutus amylolyticus TaxID=2932267 RepID=A0ABD5PLR3_9EURY|nr:hypothetical protein [Halosolutus amylolyticus]